MMYRTRISIISLILLFFSGIGRTQNNTLDCNLALEIPPNTYHKDWFRQNPPPFPTNYNCGNGRSQGGFAFYKFTASASGTAELLFKEDIDYVALSTFVLSSCNPNSCIAGGFNITSEQFSVSEGETYYIVIISSGTEIVAYDGDNSFTFLVRMPNNPVSTSSCNVTPLIESLYGQDARYISLGEMRDNENYKDVIEIPDNLYNKNLELLASVFNATGIPERDSVVECVYIHNLDPSYIFVDADENQPWAQDLLNGIIPTRNPAINDLITNHELNLIRSRSNGGIIIMEFGFTRVISLNALVEKFKTISGVSDAYVSTIQDAAFDRISVEELGGEKIIFFTKGSRFGYRIWTFLINSDCSIEFLNSTGFSLNEIYFFEEFKCSSQFECAASPEWLGLDMGRTTTNSRLPKWRL